MRQSFALAAQLAVPTSDPNPYRRLATIYFAFFAFVGVFAPYFGLYLQAIGQTAWQIGVLLSLMQAMRIVAPYLWAMLADRHGWRRRLLAAASAGAALVFCGTFVATSFAGLAIVLIAFGFFTSATMPLVESITLAGLRERFERYGGVRVWGSIGFIAAVLGGGWLLDRVAIESVLWMILAPLVVVFALALTLRDMPVGSKPVRERIWPHLARPEVVALLAANILMNAAHGPLYAFYSIYLADAGYSNTAIGALWTLSVVAEIVVFLAAPVWAKRYAAQDVLFVSFAAAVFRFAVIGWGVNSPALLLLAQLTHAATFGACHMASLALVNRWFSGARQVRGQALYLSLSFGVGGFLGVVASGAAWGTIGPAWTFTGASAAAAAGLFVLAHQARRLRRANSLSADATVQ